MGQRPSKGETSSYLKIEPKRRGWARSSRLISASAFSIMSRLSGSSEFVSVSASSKMSRLSRKRWICFHFRFQQKVCFCFYIWHFHFRFQLRFQFQLHLSLQHETLLLPALQIVVLFSASAFTSESWCSHFNFRFQLYKMCCFVSASASSYKVLQLILPAL